MMDTTGRSSVQPQSANEHLCSSCNDMVVRPDEDAPHWPYESFEQRSGTDVADSIQNGCRLCMLLGETLEIRDIKSLHKRLTITPRLGFPDDPNNRAWGGSIGGDEGAKCNRIEYVIDDKDVKGLKLANILLVPADSEPVRLYINPFRKFPNFPLPEETSSNSSFALIKTWLSFCQEYHTDCKANKRPDKWLPTRLVDVGDANAEQGPRVIETATEVLTAKPMLDSGYLCLSHRWTYMRFQLESTNIHSLKENIPIQDVSQTFRDAFIATRRLGFRYIWIDCLCIMQDHQNDAAWQDWLTESSMMGDIYKHAVLTIAATPAVDRSDQLFSARDMLKRSPLMIEIKRKPPEDMSWSLCLPTRVDVSGPYYCFSEVIWLGQVDRAPLNRRGWVYQERLLSPRTAHFTSEVFWECRQNTASEMMPMGLPDSIRTYEQPDNKKCWANMRHSIRSRFLDRYSHWKEAVEYFSWCDLTVERDKLPAIAGVAREVRLKDDKYLAGLWRSELVSQLTWRRPFQTVGNLEEYEPPKEYRAPSWSWASVNGPVEFATSEFFVDKKSKYTAIIEDCTVDLLTDDPFGQVIGGHLRLRADLIMVSSKLVITDPNWTLTFDNKREFSSNPPYYWCVPTEHVSWCYEWYLLVITPTCTEDMEFRRIGLLSNDASQKTTSLKCLQIYPDTVVTII